MPRPLRVEYAGAMYHVMSRGDRREAIFHADDDRQSFLRTLDQACQKTGWEVHAFCLMSNHFHLVLEGLTGVKAHYRHNRRVGSHARTMPRHVEQHCSLGAESQELIGLAMTELNLSARAYDHSECIA
jgi:REP element-mobilizing transposase RayT